MTDLRLTKAEQALILRKRHQAKVRAIKPKVWAERTFPKADRGRERDAGYLAFLRRLPCVACLVEPRADCGPTEAAHVRFGDAARGRINPGLQVKPSDRHAVPLGGWHHRSDQHMMSERAFWQRLGIDPGELSEALYNSYQNGGDGFAILVQFTTKAKG